MKKKFLVPVLIVLCVAIIVLRWLGIGYRGSGAAGHDLVIELESIYGPEYTGKAVDAGTEDMEFVIEPKTFFLTNYNLRYGWSLDYKYECKVIFTTYAEGTVKTVRTITYQGIDPMGNEVREMRAYLDLSSATETIEAK